MAYRLLGRTHAAVHRLKLRLADSAGQGTVEYVALILLVAGILAGVITAAGGLKGGGIAQSLVSKIKAVIEDVGKKG